MAKIPLQTVKFPDLEDEYYFPQVDDTLSKSESPADAKITGDKINELKNDVVQEQTGVVTLESGTYADADGMHKLINAARIRNARPIPVNGLISITIPDGYQAWFFRLNGDFSLISAYGSWVVGKIDVSLIKTSETQFLTFAISKPSTPTSDISSEVNTVQNGMLYVRDMDVLKAKYSDFDAIADQVANINFAGIETPEYTELTGVINDRGAVIGSLPNAHTSDIALSKGDTIIVNAYYYAGFAIVSEHSGNYYIPLIKATENARVTAKYTATHNMLVSVSCATNSEYDILVVRNNGLGEIAEKLSDGLNNTVDLSQYSWELGTINSYGHDVDSTIRIRSALIPVNAGTVITAAGASGGIDVCAFNSIGLFVSETGWIADNTYIVPNDIAYVRIVLRVSASDTTIASADIPIIRDKCTIYLKLPQSVFLETSDDGIPIYYKSMMEAKAGQIRDNMAAIGTNGDSFIFFTDFHIDSNTLHTPSLIKYLMDNCGIENVVFCGDAINRESTKAKAYEKFMKFKQLFKSQGVDFKTVVGNHEYNNPSESTEPADVSIQLTSGEIYPFFVKDEEYDAFATVDANELTYYIDNKTQKIRYLFIPCDYAGNITVGSRQFALNAISSLPSGYGVVVFTHYALQTDGNMRASFVDIANALDALVGTDKTPICVATGHTHRDLDGRTTGGVPIICTTCDSNVQVSDPSQRPAGTTNEHAFDVFQIDMTNRTITAVRIGFGADRQFTF